MPSSLSNIYKEQRSDLGLMQPRHGDLGAWVEQGVLLLNAVLTVRAHEAASHKARGWEGFSDAVIRAISARRSGVVFLLWGRFAQARNHHVLAPAARQRCRRHGRRRRARC